MPDRNRRWYWPNGASACPIAAVTGHRPWSRETSRAPPASVNGSPACADEARAPAQAMPRPLARSEQVSLCWVAPNGTPWGQSHRWRRPSAPTYQPIALLASGLCRGDLGADGRPTGKQARERGDHLTGAWCIAGWKRNARVCMKAKFRVSFIASWRRCRGRPVWRKQGCHVVRTDGGFFPALRVSDTCFDSHVSAFTRARHHVPGPDRRAARQRDSW